MNTVQRNFRLTTLEDQDLTRRAIAMKMSPADYCRMKLAESDLAPQLAGMIERLARNVGMTPSEVMERILAVYFSMCAAEVATSGAVLDPLLASLPFGKREIKGTQCPIPIDEIYDLLVWNFTRVKRAAGNKVLDTELKDIEAAHDAVMKSSKPKPATPRRKK